VSVLGLPRSYHVADESHVMTDTHGDAMVCVHLHVDELPDVEPGDPLHAIESSSVLRSVLETLHVTPSWER
jgi:hypothetical protein